MEEAGVGVLNETDGLWDDLFGREWDCKVRLTGNRFKFTPFVDAVGDGVQAGGMVTQLQVEFGPASLPAADDWAEAYGEIRKSVSFKIFDSIGKSCD